MFSFYDGILMLQYSALIRGRGHRATLVELINQKEVVGDLFNQLRLALQRRAKGRPAQVCLQLSVNRLYRSFLLKKKKKKLYWSSPLPAIVRILLHSAL